ncbi:hypothetical protein PCK1_001725 [Pneumocystis canis]|nr:hypothetical protein PCK1_001725 [Pneumocystis canis]
MIISNIYRSSYKRPLLSFYLLTQKSKNPLFFRSNVSRNIEMLKNLGIFWKSYSSNSTVKNNVLSYFTRSKLFSEKLKYLMKRYGATAASVYLVISIIDFGFSWGAVKSLGSTAIGFYEKILLEIEHRTGWQLKHSMTSLETNKKSMENESPNIWTQIAIAYGIHKLLILVRVPLTAAFTPPLVKILNQKGWSIGRLKK